MVASEIHYLEGEWSYYCVAALVARLSGVGIELACGIGLLYWCIVLSDSSCAAILFLFTIGDLKAVTAASQVGDGSPNFC